jgi:hypothetical protein
MYKSKENVECLETYQVLGGDEEWRRIVSGMRKRYGWACRYKYWRRGMGKEFVQLRVKCS